MVPPSGKVLRWDPLVLFFYFFIFLYRDPLVFGELTTFNRLTHPATVCQHSHLLGPRSSKQVFYGSGCWRLSGAFWIMEQERSRYSGGQLDSGGTRRSAGRSARFRAKMHSPNSLYMYAMNDNVNPMRL